MKTEGEMAKLNSWRAAVLAGVIAGAAASGAADAAEVKGPVPGKAELNLGAYDLGALGYQTAEYFLSGTAAAYKRAGELKEDGAWAAAPDKEAPFTTRLVVVRPTDPKRFNGTVLVEWLNVSGGADAGPDWQMAHRELIRKGFAWVGVSVQKVGVDGGASLGYGKPLKARDPERYGALSHPGDAFAFDIFSQAGRAVRGQGLLGPLTPQRLLAAGESQSAGWMTTYVNAIDPLAKVFDGVLIHSRGAGAVPIEGAAFRTASTTSPSIVRIRSDVRVPVIQVETELDVTNFHLARQPDGPKLRTWEIPGAAHADVYMLTTANMDSGREPVEALAAAFRPGVDGPGGRLAKPMNGAPQHHYLLDSAVAALDDWVRSGKAPAHGPLIALESGQDQAASAAFRRDADGIAQGGIRTPWVEAPVETFSGLGNSGTSLARLVGSTTVWDAAKLKAAYPGGKAEYLAKFKAALQRSVAAGFILPADAPEIARLAEASWPGT
jgi:hypothetical protein